ncbi:hypothetical protein [Halorubellus sp. PRR65]|uniref:hypothetical protein n=1 Tax=Halorubellus sp. PRR65 TaxID=3098148 RepID=UPI002B264391|nr:hypothetical protein [Halorubellus sp. PRR65]
MASPFAWRLAFGPLDEISPLAQGSMWLLLLLGSWAVFLESRRLETQLAWPRWQGLHYAVVMWIPLVNWIPGLLFLWQRAVRLTTGEPPKLTTWPRRLVTEPRAVVGQLLRVAGVCVSLIFVMYLLYIPFVPLREVNRPVALAWATAAVAVVPGGLWARHFATPIGRTVFDITLRDLTIRATAILGLTIFNLLAMFLVALLARAGIEVLSFAVPGDAITMITFIFVMSFLLIPVSAMLVLALRALPWLQALPYLLERVIQSLQTRVVETLPVERSRDAESDAAFGLVPFEGHSHTHVEVVQETAVSMPGRYGYFPRHVTDVEGSAKGVNLPRAFLWAVPGLGWFTGIYAWKTLYPEMAATWLGFLPAKNALVTGLSYAGIPRFAITETLALLGVPESTLSLGLVGGVVPVVLLLPTAWHAALAYESWLYRVLQRFGGHNRLLFLWTIHLLAVAPLVAVGLYLHDSR